VPGESPKKPELSGYEQALPEEAKARETMQAELNEYLTMLPRILEGTEGSRQRDINRGAAIIPDYRDTHPSVDQDPFVLEVRQEIDEERRITELLLEELV
jgi:hypothetical protein